jgi:hypothetical protein
MFLPHQLLWIVSLVEEEAQKILADVQDEKTGATCELESCQLERAQKILADVQNEKTEATCELESYPHFVQRHLAASGFQAWWAIPQNS